MLVLLLATSLVAFAVGVVAAAIAEATDYR
jgi:hypothetical protein